MRIFLGVLILLAIGIGTFSGTMYLTEKRIKEEAVQAATEKVGEPGAFVLIARNEEGIRTALKPVETDLKKSLVEMKLLKETIAVITEEALKGIEEALKTNNAGLKNLLQKEDCLTTKGELNREALLEKALPTPSPLTQALKANNTDLELFLLENKFFRKSNGAFKEFGIRFKSDGRGIELVPSRVVGFKILHGGAKFKDAARLMNKHLDMSKLGLPEGVKSVTSKGIESQLLQNKKFVAVDGTICFPVFFEIEIALPTGYFKFFPDARIHALDVERESDLRKHVMNLTKDASFRGDERDLRNQIVSENPNMLRRDGRSLDTPFRIIVDPMKRKWEVRKEKLFWTGEKFAVGELMWINFPYEIPRAFAMLKRSKAKGIPKDATSSSFEEEIFKSKSLTDGLGEIDLPIGLYVATNGSGMWKLFKPKQQGQYLPRRPLPSGGYEIEIRTDWHLQAARNFLQIDARYPTSKTFFDLERDITSRYPRLALKKKDGAVEAIYPFTIRVKPGTKSFTAHEMGSGDHHITLTNQRQEGDNILGEINRDIQLTEVARLLRAFGGPGIPPHCDGYMVKEQLLKEPRLRTRKGIQRGILFSINTETGEYEFAIEGPPKPEEPADEADESSEGGTDTDPEGLSVREHLVITEEDYDKFVKEEGIANPNLLLEELKKIGTKRPFSVVVDPKGKTPEERFQFFRLQEELTP